MPESRLQRTRESYDATGWDVLTLGGRPYRYRTVTASFELDGREFPRGGVIIQGEHEPYASAITVAEFAALTASGDDEPGYGSGV